jgi:hypothetical protein
LRGPLCSRTRVAIVCVPVYPSNYLAILKSLQIARVYGMVTACSRCALQTDGDNGASLPQDPNVRMNPLVGNVSPTPENTTTHPTSAFRDAISPVPSSPNKGSAADVRRNKSLTCSICYRLFAGHSRAEACENMHQNKRPYACINACGAMCTSSTHVRL